MSTLKSFLIGSVFGSVLFLIVTITSIEDIYEQGLFYSYVLNFICIFALNGAISVYYQESWIKTDLKVNICSLITAFLFAIATILYNQNLTILTGFWIVYGPTVLHFLINELRLWIKHITPES